MAAPPPPQDAAPVVRTAIRRVILIPGNGCSGVADLSDCMWYGWLTRCVKDALGPQLEPDSLSEEGDIRTPVFPDPLYAHESIWTDFCRNELGLDEGTLIIGHSSGAACALRLMEKFRFAGCVLVAAYDSDLGDRLERESGYFNRPFNYKAMAENVPWVLQFHSRDDHLVPIQCARRVADGLSTAFNGQPVTPGSDASSLARRSTYVELDQCGHFQEDEESDIWRHVEAQLKRPA